MEDKKKKWREYSEAIAVLLGKGLSMRNHCVAGNEKSHIDVNIGKFLYKSHYISLGLGTSLACLALF